MAVEQTRMILLTVHNKIVNQMMPDPRPVMTSLTTKAMLSGVLQAGSQFFNHFCRTPGHVERLLKPRLRVEMRTFL